jgi:hypothetical protein
VGLQGSEEIRGGGTVHVAELHRICPRKCPEGFVEEEMRT